MAKQYQSTGGVVNEPSDAQRQYQSIAAVVNTEAVAAAGFVAFPHPRGLSGGMIALTGGMQ